MDWSEYFTLLVQVFIGIVVVGLALSITIVAMTSAVKNNNNASRF